MDKPNTSKGVTGKEEEYYSSVATYLRPQLSSLPAISQHISSRHFRIIFLPAIFHSSSRHNIITTLRGTPFFNYIELDTGS